MEREALLAKLLDMLRDDERPVISEKITAALAEQVEGAADQAEAEARSLRFLKDLDIFVNWRGADFMYSRGIAETLRVGEDIWELAYQFKHAMR
jgi:hypothetical protein